MECLQIKKLILSKNKEALLDKYKELVNSKRIKPLNINREIYNNLSYLPENKRIRMSINIDFNNELEYWMWLAFPLIEEQYAK